MYYNDYYEGSKIAERLIIAMENNMTLEEATLIYPKIATFMKSRKGSLEQCRASFAKEKIKADERLKKQKEFDAKRAEIVKKLTPEERAAFGLDAKGRKKA